MNQFLIAFDQLINTMIGGYADETLSARAWRADRDGKILGKIFRPTIDFLFFFDPQHCFGSYLAEYERKQFPREYR